MLLASAPEGSSDLEPLAAAAPAAATSATVASTMHAPEKERGPRFWQVDVIRGTVSETLPFPMDK